MERVKFRINASFWLFLVVATVFKQGYFAAMYSIAVVLHELAHYVVASRLFYHCTEIRLSIFGAVLYGDFQDVTSVDRIKIALAGPVCNLVLCLTCLACWWIIPDSYYYTECFVTANLSMACVNMLPCYPLDGGRVLTGILEKRFDKRAVLLTKKITVALSLTLFALFAVSLFSGHNLFSVGMFAICLFSGVLVKTGGECYVKTTFANNRSRFLKKGMEKKTLVFNCENKLADVAKRMQGNFLYCLEVVDDEMEIVRRYSVAQLEKLVLEYPLDTQLKNLRQF